MRRAIPMILIITLLLALLLAGSAPVAGEGGAEAAALARLLERTAPAVATVRARLRVLMRFGAEQEEREQALEARGALVSPRGLVMLSNSHLSAARWSEQLGAGAVGELSVQLVPAEIRVLLEGEEEERPAVLVASDAELDLAFVQLEPPPAGALPFVDFSAPGAPAVGARFAVVSRLGTAFDAAPYLETARLAGQVRRPREAWILDGVVTAFGLPAFDLAGRPLGVLTTVLSRTTGRAAPDGGEFEGPAPAPRQRRENDRMGLFLVPADRVRTAIEGALARVAERAGEAGAPREGGSQAPGPEAPPARP
ncbi:MAG TPA: serine protease [Thermoanaerobaculia bacterium]|nr:serine protease [Thermoanaerobaculia bacterium]